MGVHLTEAICEAVTRANMRFVETKTPEQQNCLNASSYPPALHPPADFGDQTLRAHMAELGVVAAVGRKGVEQLLAIATDASDQRVPELARAGEVT